jgi:membrane fusion protein (multidrug efflux system)
MQKKTKIIIFVLIILTIVGIIVFPYIKDAISSDDDASSAAGSAGFGKRDAPPLTVKSQIIQYETLSDNFKTIGSILPDEEVNLSFETSGKITRIQFQEGSNVKR